MSDKEKDRVSTETKLLKALESIIIEDGFEKIGVNLIASRSGVSKVLIYRYFGSLDNMILEYLTKQDFWINVSLDMPDISNLRGYIKTIFHNQIINLRTNKVSQRLKRWELNSSNNAIDKIRLKRESKNVTLITLISHLGQYPQEEVASLATIIGAAINYLVLLSENCPIYNGIDLQTDRGWEQITSGIDLLIDKWLDNTKTK